MNSSPSTTPESAVGTDSSGVTTDEPHFAFGANWSRFLETVNEDRIAAAVQSLQQGLNCETLAGKTFLDIGCGSGLFSLAAHRLGAQVFSFDYDPQSVACTEEIRRRFGFQDDGEQDWQIEQGSILDPDDLTRYERTPFDVVYSWGVLHHTGEMWQAIRNAGHLVKPGGQLWIAIYNDQGPVSALWTRVKAIYQWLPRWLRPPYVMLMGGLLFAWKLLGSAGIMLARLCLLQNPWQPARQVYRSLKKADTRGMHRWYDLVDWVGGWPFEVATPAAIHHFLQDRGFVLEQLTTCGGKLGCNEFVYQRTQ